MNNGNGHSLAVRVQNVSKTFGTGEAKTHALKGVDFARQLPVAGEHAAQLHKGAHHIDTQFGGARAVQQRSRHDGTMLGKNVRRVFAVLTASGL